MLKKIGYIESIDFEGLLKELKPLDRQQRDKKYWQNGLYNIQKQYILEDRIQVHNCTKLLLADYYSKSAEDCYKTSLEIVNRIQKSEKHNKLFNIRFEVKYIDDRFCAFMYSSGSGVVIPVEYVKIEYSKDYSSLTFNQVSNLISSDVTTGSIMSLDNKNQLQIEQEMKQAESDLEEAEKNAKTELKAFEEKMREMERQLREKQEIMLSELRSKVENIKDQIFILEMNIFALRSYFGETFSIAHVMKGKNAPEEQPLVLFQKFRYMDEDLSRLTANSDFSTCQTGIVDLFETYGSLFIETFCPNSKCITFFKASRDNKYLEYNREDDVISELEYYHGNQIGMLIRNGENLYLSFIDEEITLQDNLFMSKSTENSEVGIKIGETKIRDKEARNLINRKHIFIILQALLKNTNIFESHKNESIFNSSKILFSDSDSQIKYDNYPSFKEFFKNNNGYNDDIIKYGDYIFVDEHHAGSKQEQNYWGSGYHEEHRGKGYRNTGRDADISKGLNKLSIVDKYQDGYYVFYQEGSTTYKKYTYTLDNDLIKAGNRYEPNMKVEYYVSCKREIDAYDWRRYNPYKREYDSNKKFNNANLRIYPDEFMSIMWCNSNYVQQWIDNKDSGNGKNYVYFVKMLKELKEFMQKREEKEFEEINKFIQLENNNKNKDIVLEWKIQNKIRTLSEFQAKRFSKYYKENFMKV